MQRRAKTGSRSREKPQHDLPQAEHGFLAYAPCEARTHSGETNARIRQAEEARLHK